MLDCGSTGIGLTGKISDSEAVLVASVIGLDSAATTGSVGVIVRLRCLADIFDLLDCTPSLRQAFIPEFTFVSDAGMGSGFVIGFVAGFD